MHIAYTYIQLFPTTHLSNKLAAPSTHSGETSWDVALSESAEPVPTNSAAPLRSAPDQNSASPPLRREGAVCVSGSCREFRWTGRGQTHWRHVRTSPAGSVMGRRDASRLWRWCYSTEHHWTWGWRTRGSPRPCAACTSLYTLHCNSVTSTFQLHLPSNNVIAVSATGCWFALLVNYYANAANQRDIRGWHWTMHPLKLSFTL